MVFNKIDNIFAESWSKSPKIVITTLSLCTRAGFYLTTRKMFTGGSNNTRPRRQGKGVKIFSLKCLPTNYLYMNSP
jgi:hypothetical protein